MVFSRGIYTSEEEYGKYYAKKKMTDTERHMLYDVISTGEKKQAVLVGGHIYALLTVNSVDSTLYTP